MQSKSVRVYNLSADGKIYSSCFSFSSIFIQALQVKPKLTLSRSFCFFGFSLLFFSSLFFNYYCPGSGHTHTQGNPFLISLNNRGSLAQFMASSLSLALARCLAPDELLTFFLSPPRNSNFTPYPTFYQ